MLTWTYAEENVLPSESSKPFSQVVYGPPRARVVVVASACPRVPVRERLKVGEDPLADDPCEAGMSEEA